MITRETSFLTIYFLSISVKYDVVVNLTPSSSVLVSVPSAFDFSLF